MTTRGGANSGKTSTRIWGSGSEAEDHQHDGRGDDDEAQVQAGLHDPPDDGARAPPGHCSPLISKLGAEQPQSSGADDDDLRVPTAGPAVSVARPARRWTARGSAPPDVRSFAVGASRSRSVPSR